MREEEQEGIEGNGEWEIKDVEVGGRLDSPPHSKFSTEVKIK